MLLACATSENVLFRRNFEVSKRRNKNFMSSSSVEQIKSKLDIVTVVSAYVKLEKAGGNWKGRCPFHNEKTPSFFVSPDRGSYYCFGCQAKGDIFTFVQEFEGLDFVGALKVLAERAGVELEKFNSVEKSEKDKFYSVLEQAVFFYQKKLSENKTAQDYLKKRGITEETIKNFRIGFAPDEWRGLHDFLSGKNVFVTEMLSVGLVKKAEGQEKYYDRFRGRIMFPIADSSGRVVGFSGRILVADDKAPKYLNSPETTLFNKSEILFGLDKAKKEIRLRDYSILVEGQMDLVMMHQVGITNTVASSGTALSVEHLTKLRRLSNRIIMSYDGDSAGFAASDRSGKLALSLGMDLKIAQMPEGVDPADLALKNPDELREILRKSKHIIDFLTDALLSRKLDSRVLGKEIQTRVLPYVVLLQSSIEKSHFIKNIAQKTFIKEEALWDDLKGVNIGTDGKNTPDTSGALGVPATSAGERVVTSRVSQIERRLSSVIIWQKSLSEPIIDIVKIEKKFAEIAGAGTLDILKEKGQNEMIFEAEAYYGGRGGLDADVAELLVELEKEYLKNKLNETMTLLQKAERERNSAEVLKYLEECQKISQKINKLKSNNL
jgi:DNA primase